VLGERELHNGCVSRFSIFKDVTSNPSTREKRCPGTPCVPARRDGHYVISTRSDHKPRDHAATPDIDGAA
jgi:hypothetical protein